MSYIANSLYATLNGGITKWSIKIKILFFVSAIEGQRGVISFLVETNEEIYVDWCEILSIVCQAFLILECLVEML